MPTTMLGSEFKHQDKLQAIRLAERNSLNNNPRKAITVQHFNDAGQPDSPAEIVLCDAGHSPVAIQSINGGYFVAAENDTEAAVQTRQWQGQREREYQNQ
jgi:hypothetical protein